MATYSYDIIQCDCMRQTEGIVKVKGLYNDLHEWPFMSNHQVFDYLNTLLSQCVWISDVLLYTQQKILDKILVKIL